MCEALLTRKTRLRDVRQNKRVCWIFFIHVRDNHLWGENFSHFSLGSQKGALTLTLYPSSGKVFLGTSPLGIYLNIS